VIKNLNRLGWKLFFSYLVIILVGTASLAIAAEYTTPNAFNRHLANMDLMMMESTGSMMTDLVENFQLALNEILLVSSILSIITAVFVSSFVTRRIVKPVEEMQIASQRIAGGRYDERVHVTSNDELGDLGRSFNQMANKLSQTEERRRQLIGDVAHELRTPLSSIRSVMEGIIDGVLPAVPSTFLDVQKEVSRLQRLVYDLEELSKAEAGELLLELDWVNPIAFIDSAVLRLAPQYEDKGISLQTTIPQDLPKVYVDQARMTQVMLNLLGNALQYMQAETGKEEGQVIVKAWADLEHFYLSVQDNGLGIAAENISFIFERFYRVDKSRSRSGGGSGIGLTISKHIIEGHRGSLAVSSKGIDQGTTFTISLPLSL
jgi:signal transduction histidine kinase